MESGARRARGSAARPRVAILFLPCLIVAGTYVLPIRLGVVCGESMSPALHHGQVFLMRRMGKRGRFQHGDIVVVEVNGQQHIKRVYALAGETVAGLDWKETYGHPDYLASSRDMRLLPELVRRQPAVGRLVRVTVPRGHLFVVGDAITRSYDSRHFGPVPVEKVAGRLVATLFSVGRGGVSYPRAMALEVGNSPQASEPLN